MNEIQTNKNSTPPNIMQTEETPILVSIIKRTATTTFLPYLKSHYCDENVKRERERVVETSRLINDQ